MTEGAATQTAAKLMEQTWDLLEGALSEIVYTRDPPPGPRFRLVRDDASNYAVLYVFTYNPNTYRPDQMRHTRHEFVVPVATYSRSTWIRWVFDRIAAIEVHETCESFQLLLTSTEPDDGCTGCPHPAREHDGRDSSCVGCEGEHRYSAKVPRTYRPYAPHHGNGEDPYAFWPGGTAGQKSKAPGED